MIAEIVRQNSTQMASGVLIALCVIGTMLALWARDWRAHRPAILLFLSVLLGILAIEVGGLFGYGLLAAGALLAWPAAVIARGVSIGHNSDLPRRFVVILIAAVTLALTGLTFYRLDNYSGTVMTWESPVIVDLLSELRDEKTLVESFKQRLRWNHGVLSGGASSLVFGLPALMGLKFVGADFFILRLPAAMAFLGACVALFLVTRRSLGVVAAVSALCFFGLNQVVLIYARYGSSAAGSMCALIFALFACVQLVQRQRLVWAPVAAGCLYLATLGYSPARVPVLLLVLMTPIGVWTSSGHSIRRRAAASLAFALSLLPVVLFQISAGAMYYYFAARGEQFFGLLVSKYWPDPIRSLQSVALSTKPLSPGETVGIAIELVRQVTGPQLLGLLDPLSPDIKRASDASILPFHDDPLFLKIVAPLVIPMVLLGICGCLRARYFWLSTLLLGWLISCCGSALLSNRVDDHRLLFSVVPLSMFAAFGVAIFVRSWKLFKGPFAPIFIAATAFYALAVLPRTADMYDASRDENPGVSALRQLVTEIPAKELTVTTDMFHGDVAVLRLSLWRQLGKDEKKIAWSSPELRDALDKGLVAYRPGAARRIAEKVRLGSTLILHPGSRYQRAASYIAREGVSVFSRSIGSHNFLVIDQRADPPAPGFQKADLPQVPLARPIPLVLPEVSGVPVSSLTPLRESYGFSEMRRNKTWGGSSIIINGVAHESGLGVHAPTTIRFAVPEGATSFQSIVAIDDDAQACALGSARLTIRDQQQRVLHRTEVVTSSSPTVVVLDMQGVRELELEIDDAGDGRDCDHLDLADALFVVPQGSTAACVCPKTACPKN